LSFFSLFSFFKKISFLGREPRRLSYLVVNKQKEWDKKKGKREKRKKKSFPTFKIGQSHKRGLSLKESCQKGTLTKLYNTLFTPSRLQGICLPGLLSSYDESPMTDLLTSSQEELMLWSHQPPDKRREWICLRTLCVEPKSREQCCQYHRHGSSMDSGLEAFSRYPTHGSFSALTFQSTDKTKYANQLFLSY
jgi:hypothetical protein